MPAQHFIILIGLIISGSSLAYYIRRAITRGHVSAYQLAVNEYQAQITALTNELAAAKTGQQAVLTTRDLQTLLDILVTLDMAHQTWVPIKGTEPWRARTKAQILQLNLIATRIYDALHVQQPAVLADQIAPGKAA